MRRSTLLALALLLLASASGAFAACNSPQGDCPAASAIVPGGACSGDQLQCEYDLSTPSVACDGTSTVIPSSCTCTEGTWSCPSPVDCGDAGPAEDGAAQEDAAPDAGQADAAPEAAAVDARADAASDAGAADTGNDAPEDSGGGG